MTVRWVFTSLCVVVLSCLCIACEGTSAPTFTVVPTIAPNPNPAVPLAAIVSAETSEPTMLMVSVSDGTRDWSVPVASALATRHTVPVLGFRPGRRHVVEVTARNAAGNVSAAVPLEFDTPPLPGDFPRIDVTVSEPGRMEPGVTLFALMRWPEGGEPDEDYGLALAVDEQGEVVWYRRTDYAFEDPHRLGSGNLIGIAGTNRAEEVDMLGNVVTSWHASRHPNPEASDRVPPGSIAVPTETFHHDIQEMPSGNLLVLSTEMRRVEDYPTALDDPDAERAPANVIGDVVVEFSPRDGSIVGEWKLMDTLDVSRLGYESLGQIWDDWAYVDVEGGTRDWSHSNSISYQRDTDSILVSVRHQEAVISLSRRTGSLNWIFGTHDGWRDRWSPYLLQPQGDFEWPYHQHAVEVTSNGSLILFDNGNFRSLPPAARVTLEQSYSRAAEYTIDPESRTVRQTWTYGGPADEVFYSPFISEADLLPRTGNVLVTDGGRIRDEQGRPSDRIVGGHHWARIVEVTHTDRPEKVFEMTIDSAEKDGTIGWAVYRSDRLPSLYAN